MQKIDWNILYTLLLDVIKNYPLKIVAYTAICLFIGLVFSTTKILVFKKYKVISRQHRYYNLFVKLYIPAVFIITMIFSLKIGLFWGVYEAVKKDSYPISKQVYQTSSYYIFKEDTSKAVFISDLKSIVSELSKDNTKAKVEIVDIVKAYDLKYKAVDTPKNWLAKMFVDRYGDKIHTLVVYGMLNAVPGTHVSESISYHEFDRLAGELTRLDVEHMEHSIIEKIQHLFLYILKYQFRALIKGALIIWALLMLIPWVEFVIYTCIMKRKNSSIHNKQV